jgi:hypothetical protein
MTLVWLRCPSIGCDDLRLQEKKAKLNLEEGGKNRIAAGDKKVPLIFRHSNGISSQRNKLETFRARGKN